MALREMTVQLNQWYQGFKASSWGQMPGLSVMVELSLLGHFQWGASDPVCQIICCNPQLSYLTGARCPARWLHARKRSMAGRPLSEGLWHRAQPPVQITAGFQLLRLPALWEPVTRLSRGKRLSTSVYGNIRSLAGFTRTLAAGRECSTRSLKYLCESERGLMRHSSL